MRAASLLLLILALGSCRSVTHEALNAPRERVGRWSLGVGINDWYGLWEPTYTSGDGTAEKPFDTTWTSIMLYPTHIALDDTFLVVLSKHGKYLLTVKQPDGKETWKRARTEKRYVELRAELGVPDSLILRPLP